MKKQIAFVVTYFGELPFYFPAFQISCSYNPHIQWLIFTDCDAPKDLPANITFINISIGDFNTLATQKLGYEIQIVSDFLYKICDFKPAFGVIYEDYLREYSFWGHCDIDIVWGKIDHFVDSKILHEYDIITSRPGRISGHFGLYRNTDKINSVFIAMPVTENLLKQFTTCERLDEVHFTNYLRELVGYNFLSRMKMPWHKKSFRPRVYWHKVLTTAGKHQRELSANPEKYFKWKQGNVYHTDGSEMMYLHFHKLKDSMQHIDFSYDSNPNEFLVTAKKMIAT